MAGNIVFVDHQGNILGQWALGLGAAVQGICYDGFYFWAVDGTYVYQLFQKDDGTFSIVSQFNAKTAIPDSTSIDCIETDGYNLFVGYQGVSGFPLAAFGYVAKVSKEGKCLSPAWGMGLGAIAPSWIDICWTGAELWGIRNTNMPSPNNFAFKIANADGVTVWKTNQRSDYNALAFDGLNFPTATGTNRFNILDTERKPLAVNVNLALAIKSGCCIRNNHRSDFRIDPETTITAFGYN